jgi:transcriptional regulator with XRE-family HTH domain
MEHMEFEKSRIAQLVDERVQELRGVKSQKDIAREAGYKSQNMITMIKNGDTKVSLDRVPDLARALEVNPKAFLLLAMEQFYSGDLIKKMMIILEVDGSEPIKKDFRPEVREDPASTTFSR